MAALLAVSWPLLPRDAVPLDKFIHKFELSYRNVRTLRAEFSQAYVWGQRRRAESGTVYLARGGKMRWEYRSPMEKLFLSDGKTLWLYVPAEKQLTRSRVRGSEDARVPLRLLLSRLDFRKVFSTIGFADDALAARSGNRVLRALPRQGEDKYFREVLVELSPAFVIRRLVVVYPDRSSMEFTFDRVEQNVRVGPDLFRLAVPPGTEVIDQP